MRVESRYGGKMGQRQGEGDREEERLKDQEGQERGVEFTEL